MLALASLLAILAPQDAVTVRARPQKLDPSAMTRQLPKKNTLGVLEIVSVDQLLESEPRMLPVEILQQAKVQGFLRWIGSTQEEFGRFLGHAPELGQLFRGMNNGLAIAWIFQDEGRSSPELAFLGSSSDIRWLREQPARLRSMIEVDPAQLGDKDERKFTAQTLPIEGSPVMADVFRLKGQTVSRWGWEQFRNDFIMTARRGRTMGMLFGREYGQEDRRSPKFLNILASSLGLSGLERGGNDLDTPRSASPEGSQVLGRIAFRWRDIINQEGRVRPSDREEMASLGMDRFIGARSELRTEQGQLVDEIELHVHPRDGAKTPISPFELLRPTQGGLRKAAEILPSSTFAALHGRLSARELQSWLRVAMKMNRVSEEEQNQFFHYVHMLLGLSPADSKPTQAVEWPEELGITAFLMPPEMGPVPELFIAVEIGDRQVDTKAILTRVAQDIAFRVPAEEIPSKIKTLGRGPDAVPYIKITDLLNMGGMTSSMEMQLLGGRYLSVARMGDKLVFGMHPRALRKARRAVAKGDTLASNANFAARFDSPTENPLEFWLDADGLRKSSSTLLGVFNGPMFWLVFGMSAQAVGNLGPGGEAEEPEEEPEEPKMIIPDWAELLELFEDESIVVEKSEFGLRARVVGKGLLSPTIWTGLGFAIVSIDEFSPLLRPLSPPLKKND